MVEDFPSSLYTQNYPKRRLACAPSSNGASCKSAYLRNNAPAHLTPTSPSIHPTTNITKHPARPKQITYYFLENHQQWPVEKENHRAGSLPEARVAMISERSSRAIPARQDFRLVLRKALFNIIRGIGIRLGDFRRLVRWWTSR